MTNEEIQKMASGAAAAESELMLKCLEQMKGIPGALITGKITKAINSYLAGNSADEESLAAGKEILRQEAGLIFACIDALSGTPAESVAEKLRAAIEENI